MQAYKIKSAPLSAAVDLSRLAQRSKAYWGYSEDFMRACREELTFEASRLTDEEFWQLTLDEQIVGFYSLDEISETLVDLGNLFVDPDFIGKGYGTALMQHAKQHAIAKGYSVMHIDADPNALVFYKSHGGKVIGEHASQSIPGRLLPLLEIKLGHIQ